MSPTPTGKPKVGERIRYRGYDGRGEVFEGTVLERTRGADWSLHVDWDGHMAPRGKGGKRWLVDCEWLLRQGYLEVIS